MSVQLNLRYVGGTMKTMDVDLNEKIEDLKKKLDVSGLGSRKSCVPSIAILFPLASTVQATALVFEGIRVLDSLTVGEAGLANGSGE